MTAAPQNPQDIAALEKKWQDRWEQDKTFEVEVNELKNKHYLLTMFPYPSGDNLHMGHWYQYGLVDTWARFQLMRGKEIFQPMGFDAFGLPAENFAIKKGIHPDASTSRNVAIMQEQFKRMGVAYSWKYLLNTSKPDYYKWTQKLFLDLYDNNLAYKKQAPVNWCTSCQTVLANEQVKEGNCERCDSFVTKKNLNQWFFRITAYSQDLLDGIDTLNWPTKTAAMQKHWIGRSQGAEVKFAIEGRDKFIEVFTTRVDTLMGVTYVTLAPEHPLTLKITSQDQQAAVEAYCKQAAARSEIERMSASKEKTGVFSGSYAIHPVSGAKVPIWIGDYVLVSYGTGAVMAVPGHDSRDYEFAKCFELPVQEVIKAPETATLDGDIWTGDGVLINSDNFNGLEGDQARLAISGYLEEKNLGKATVTYRLRDWLVSRQRYWGCPIPIIHCQDCGEVKVPDSELPVKLPEDVAFRPDGASPLARCDSFVNTTCPQCHKPAQREVDTLDTFVCSSWYFLRFPNVGNDQEAFDSTLTNKILPVDTYVGGPEHACMHLLYARFITHALCDMGRINFKEPFPHLIHQGLVLGADGNKMSKSKGNAVSPDPYVTKHGADILRLFLCFGFNYVDGGPWDDGGFVAVTRFMDKITRLYQELGSLIKAHPPSEAASSPADKQLRYQLHFAIKGISQDTERFMFNTSIARLMELYNALAQYTKQPEADWNKGLLSQVLTNFLQTFAPFAPHRAEELWEAAGNNTSIFKSPWPEWQEKYLVQDQVKIGGMVNGKFRAELEVASDADQDQVLAVAQNTPAIQKHLHDKAIIKVIYVPKKMINIVVK